MQSLRFIGHKQPATMDSSNIMDISSTSHRNNLSLAPTTATSSGLHHNNNSSNSPVTITQLQQVPRGSSVMGHNTSTFADHGNGTTTGPIAINPILGSDNGVIGSPTRSDNPIRLLADTSSAALMNVINNSAAMMMNNQSNLVSSNDDSTTTTTNLNGGNMTNNSEYESKLLINSLYRKGSRRRRLIQNPWDHLEYMGLMSTANMESINPRYSSRPELFGHGSGHYVLGNAGRHLRSSSSGSSSNNVSNLDNHVYECIDADSIHNYNIITPGQYHGHGHR